MMKQLCLVILFILFCHTIRAQSWQDTLQIIDKTFSRYQPGHPGCQLSISRNGEIIFSKAWGMADLEQNVSLTTHSVIEAGSVSKQFTAAAILLLEQQGKLSLDDDVRKYVPEIPDYGYPIKLRYMLHHTSGIRDWGAVASLTGWPRTKKFYTNDDALDIIIHQQHLNNIPNAEYIYSNSNYNLFAIIVQRVSGLSLAAFTHKYIFGPAGMTLTQWRDDPNRIVPNRAIAYDKRDTSYQTDMPDEYVYGNGGLLTCAEDLLKWNNFYQQRKLGGPTLLSTQIKTEPFNNGVMHNYAAGLVIGKIMGWDNISHSGATAGYRAYLETFPELGLSMAVLSNTSEFNIVEPAAMIRRVFVTGKPGKNVPKENSFEPDAPALNHFAGLYRNDRDKSTFTLSVKDNHLFLGNQTSLTATSEHTFSAGNFIFVINGIDGLYIPLSPRDTIPFTKVNPVHLSQKDFDRYTGTYFSTETSSPILIRENNGKLVIQLKPGTEYEMAATYKDAFKADAADADIIFTMDKGSTINSMHIYVPRARDVTFKKTQ
ncbi:MAG: serine hydrolase domain-containing protein [Bacteroidota bacterium]